MKRLALLALVPLILSGTHAQASDANEAKGVPVAEAVARVIEKAAAPTCGYTCRMEMCFELGYNFGFCNDINKAAATADTVPAATPAS